jgi:Cu(I)/Ag(I) efflux system membrane protein CusA/SilA
VQALIAGAVGGENVTETVEGLARDPVNLCCPLEWRDTPQRLVDLPILTPLGQQITLGRVAAVSISDGPPMIKREDARPAGWVYTDVPRRDLASVAKDLRRRVAAEIKRDPGMSVVYSGQFEFLERVNARLMLLVPATLMIIFVWLYLTFGWLDEALLIMATLPFALTVGVWFLNALGYPMSVATGVGFIALAGVAPSAALVNEAIRGGAVPRVRP